MSRYISGFMLSLFFMVNTVSAVTLIEIDSKEDGRTQVITDGSKARINSGQDQSYVIIDYKKQSMHIVMPEDKQIMDMSGKMPSMKGKSAAVKIKIVPMGKGPVIAGYSTNKFSLKAEGKNCGTIYGSADAMKAPGISSLIETMNSFAEKQRAAMGSYGNMMGACEKAKMSLSTQAKEVGVPMREVDAKGNVDNEIIRIDTKASLPAGAFVLPGGYKTVSFSDQMKQAEKGVSEANKHQPEMQELMNQMQQAGSVNPEAMKEMQRLKEILMHQQR